MPTITDIRAYMDSWKQHTYRQGIDYCYSIKKDNEVFECTVEVLNKQKIATKNMDGYSIQNIPIKNEGKVDIIFSEIFWKLTEGYISPASFVGEIVRLCIERNIKDVYEICGIVGRGLRSFPSFLREMDLTYKLARYFPNAVIENNPEQDVKDHTDILIRCDNQKVYRIWSYQNFERGLVNTASRLRGNRGTVPDGMHILCPIDIGNKNEVEEKDGWFFYSDNYVHYLYSMQLFEAPDEYSYVSRMTEYAVKMYLKKPGIIKK